ncbi:hypothetical protein G7067_12980 [Leucobacter insecticola]|uniref:Thioredoxin-like fold domain-containing protein n=1 Tax=Leucobacter insecticola TaxID=2714934 RepID=A0A6G8FL87_9MICO|nr:DsbA family protein [Leucobacter insecticola]QIM17114.1 hypothetical protein G7067_12980 [Leucobacter insecticola]
MSAPQTPQTPGPPPHPYASSGGNPGSGRRRGLIFGAIGVAVVLIVATIVFVVLSNSNNPNNGGDKNDSSNSSDSAEVAKPVPTTPANVTRWPANMATGSIAFTGDDGKVTVVKSEALPEGAQPLVSNLAPTADGAEPNRIQLYVDYRCPYCSLFEAANVDSFEAVLASGDTVLELHPLAFLDKFSAGTYYSSRASGRWRVSWIRSRNTPGTPTRRCSIRISSRKKARVHTPMKN